MTFTTIHPLHFQTIQARSQRNLIHLTPRLQLAQKYRHNFSDEQSLCTTSYQQRYGLQHLVITPILHVVMTSTVSAGEELHTELYPATCSSRT